MIGNITDSIAPQITFVTIEDYEIPSYFQIHFLTFEKNINNENLSYRIPFPFKYEPLGSE